MTESSEITSSDPAVVRAWLEKHHRKQLALLDKFLTELRLGRLAGAGNDDDNPDDRRKVVLQTVELLKHLLGPTSWKSAAELLSILKAIGYEMNQAGGRGEPAMGNVIRRIMAAVREEAVREGDKSAASGTGATANTAATDNRLSLQSMLWALPQHVKTTGSTNTAAALNQRQESFAADAAVETEFPAIYYKHRPDLKQSVMEVLQETLSDLEDTYNSINEQVTSHIHAGEVILTCGKSRTTEAFLKAAALKKKRHFQVLVCEGAPGYGGHEMARSLAAAGIDTVVIHDAAIFAMMARVHKVIIPAHAVLANGGLIANSGCNLVASAANHHSVPVVCITGIFKLCPVFPHEGQDTLNDLLSPAAVMDYTALTDRKIADVEFVNPLHDYIQPNQISLYVTNVGSFQPSFIYRLLAECYHTDDWASFD
uniref:Translation initiation factor eIF2B subunit beta n=1 Tax=Amphora coffeiformis TaxID=265554 RepID=A0A7S3LDB3_9STRA|eukprot:scaffold310_cov168-Amphora_coffeaeformis.AAC.43